MYINANILHLQDMLFNPAAVCRVDTMFHLIGQKLIGSVLHCTLQGGDACASGAWHGMAGVV